MSRTVALAGRLRTDHPYLLAVGLLELVFLVLPSLVVLVVSLGASRIISFPPAEFTLQWYVSLLEQPQYVDPFINSVFVATFCTALSIPVGVATAIGLNRYDVRFEHGLQIYLLLPFTVPLVVSGFVLLVIFGWLGWIGDLWAVGLALTIINIPFMIWSVASSVNALENAARSLGAEELQTFVHVTLPALMPGVISGAFLMFMLALNEFLVSLIITTNATETLPVAIYSAIRGNISPQVAAVSSVYVVVAVVAIVVADRLVGLERFLHS